MGTQAPSPPHESSLSSNKVQVLYQIHLQKDDSLVPTSSSNSSLVPTSSSNSSPEDCTAEMVPNGARSRIVAQRSSDGMAHDDEGTFRVNIDKQPNIIPSPEEEVNKNISIIFMLEHIASLLGLVKYLWVPVMWPNNHLGFITLILLLEGIHAYLRNRELVLYHMHNMKQLPNPICFFSWLLYWLDLISVITSGVLSVIGLAYLLHHMHNMQHDCRKRDEVLVFYAITISEVLVFLAARAIWKWKVSYCRLLEKVIDECGLKKSDMDSIKRFSYDMHSKCVEDWKIIDMLKTDLVTYAGDLLVSNLSEDQLVAARILKALSAHPHLSDAAVRKIGTSKVLIERLIQMLNSKNLFEENIRCMAAVIVSELVDKEPNVLRVAGMDEAMKSANYLLGLRQFMAGDK